MKKVVMLVLCMLLIFTLIGCGHQHTWQEANCTSPKTCTECGETEGEALGHIWEEANCQHPEQCAICGSTKNTKLGDHECHSWSEVVDPTCSEDGFKKGICINCGQEFTVISEKLPHSFGDWEETKAASCVEIGERKHVCKDCDFEEAEQIPLLEHDLDEWKTVKEATYNENGVKEQKCRSCTSTINTEEFTFADTIKDKVKFKGDSSNLVLTDVNLLYSSSWGYISGEVIIEITNNGESSIKISKANVDLIDNEGLLLETFDEYSTNMVPAIIEPGQKGYILCDLFASDDELDIRNGVDVDAFVTVEKTSDKRSQWEFTDLNTKGNDPETVGHVTNADTVAYDSLTVYCLYRDITGRVIGYTVAYADNQIAPGDRVSFSSYNSYSGLIKASNVTDIECIGVGYRY